MLATATGAISSSSYMGAHVARAVSVTSSPASGFDGDAEQLTMRLLECGCSPCADASGARAAFQRIAQASASAIASAASASR